MGNGKVSEEEQRKREKGDTARKKEGRTRRSGVLGGGRLSERRKARGKTDEGSGRRKEKGEGEEQMDTSKRQRKYRKWLTREVGYWKEAEGVRERRRKETGEKRAKEKRKEGRQRRGGEIQR